MFESQVIRMAFFLDNIQVGTFYPSTNRWTNRWILEYWVSWIDVETSIRISQRRLLIDVEFITFFGACLFAMDFEVEHRDRMLDQQYYRRIRRKYVYPCYQ